MARYIVLKLKVWAVHMYQDGGVDLGGSARVMALVVTLGAVVISRRGTTDVFWGGNGDGKPEGYCLGETM